MKRFTSTEKWEDSWFRSLPPTSKLLFLYFLDKCDLAGFLEVDIPLITFHTGLSEDEILGAKQGLNRGCLGAENWLWMKNFLKHQKNLPLNPSNNAHKHIILLIREQIIRFKDHNIIKILGADQGLFSPLGIGIGKGKGKGKVSESKIKCFFKDSIYFDKNKFKEKLPDWSKEKILHYYTEADVWSNEGNKKIDWIATVKNWARRDELKGGVKFATSSASWLSQDHYS